jgi:DNA anti-recombination protein RmuC
MATPVDFQKLADLLNQLGTALGTLNTSINAFLSAQSAMNAALSQTNAIGAQINALGVGITVPVFTVPVEVDQTWVQSILDSAAAVQAQGDALKAATPVS